MATTTTTLDALTTIQMPTIGAARRAAELFSRRTGQDVPTKAMIDVCVDLKRQRAAYAGANGLTSIKGGSGEVNARLASGPATFGELAAILVGHGCPTPAARLRACLNNCEFYAQPKPLRAAGLLHLCKDFTGHWGVLCNGSPIVKGQKYLDIDVISIPCMGLLHGRLTGQVSLAPKETPAVEVAAPTPIVRKAGKNASSKPVAAYKASPAGRTSPCVFKGTKALYKAIMRAA